MLRLISLFDEVKKTYFSRWDPSGEWQIRSKTRLSEGYNGDAMCNQNTKTIEIQQRFIAKDDNEFRCLLAHEMCHAVVNGNHGQKWQTRFLKVANLAELLRQRSFADKIRAEVKLFQNAQKPTLHRIRQSIEDALLDQPDASFELVIKGVAHNWGYTADGLTKRYPFLKKYFDKAKRDALLVRDLREKYHTGSLHKK